MYTTSEIPVFLQVVWWCSLLHTCAWVAHPRMWHKTCEQSYTLTDKSRETLCVWGVVCVMGRESGKRILFIIHVKKNSVPFSSSTSLFSFSSPPCPPSLPPPSFPLRHRSLVIIFLDDDSLALCSSMSRVAHSQRISLWLNHMTSSQGTSNHHPPCICLWVCEGVWCVRVCGVRVWGCVMCEGVCERLGSSWCCQKTCRKESGGKFYTTCSSSSYMIWCRSEVVLLSKDTPQLAFMWVTLAWRRLSEQASFYGIDHAGGQVSHVLEGICSL